MPHLTELGGRWERGDATVAQEHYESQLIRDAFVALARGPRGSRTGMPRALLACAPGERHDIPLLAFAVALGRHGWEVEFLGPDVPVRDLVELAYAVSYDAAVVSASVPSVLRCADSSLATLAGRTRLYLGGPGARASRAERVGAELLDSDPVTAATLVDGAWRGRPG